MLLTRSCAAASSTSGSGSAICVHAERFQSAMVRLVSMMKPASLTPAPFSVSRPRRPEQRPNRWSYSSMVLSLSGLCSEPISKQANKIFAASCVRGSESRTKTRKYVAHAQLRSCILHLGLRLGDLCTRRTISISNGEVGEHDETGFPHPRPLLCFSPSPTRAAPQQVVILEYGTRVPSLSMLMCTLVLGELGGNYL